MSAPQITLSGLSRRYQGQGGIADLTLTLPAGRITAILGASGSGKSTLLRLIAGLERLEAGQIHFDADLMADAKSAVPTEKRQLGLVFQDHALFSHLRVWENVAFGLRGAQAEKRRQALNWLEHVGLARYAEAFPGTLSGGEQQRVALARALAPRPRVVLLDEPFSSLDPVLRGDLRERTRALLNTSGATTAFVTHSASEALYLADHLAIIKDGRLLQAGSPQAVYRHPISAEAAGALGPVQLLKGEVRGQVLHTAFGALAAPGLADGEGAIGLVRQEALELTSGDIAEILALRPQGSHDLLQIQAGQEAVWVRAAPGQAPPVSSRVGLRIDPAGAHVFRT